MALLWVFNLADGRHPCWTWRNAPEMAFDKLAKAADAAVKPISFGVATDGVRCGEHIHIP